MQAVEAAAMQVQSKVAQQVAALQAQLVVRTVCEEPRMVRPLVEEQLVWGLVQAGGAPARRW